jgi:hypothetical protein
MLNLTWSHIAARKLQIWYRCSKNRTESRIARSWRTFSSFQRLPMCLNPTNELGILIIESYRWLLEILVWTKRSDLVTSKFGFNQSEIEGNSEYRSRRGFHKLCKGGRNAWLWCRTKKPWSGGVGRILKIWLWIGIDFFMFLLVLKICFLIQYEYMMPCNMTALYVPRQKKSSSNIDGVRIVGGKVTLIPVVSSNETILRNRG